MANEGGGSGLAPTAQTKLLELLYSDLRHLLVSKAGSAWTWILNRARRAGAVNYDSIAVLAADVNAGRIQPDTVVKLRARPSAFGPYTRSQFLVPILGPSVSRLGPPLLHENPLLGMLGNTMTHWMPVGMFPSVDAKLVQGTLYESTDRACGVVTIMEAFAPKIVTLPFLASTRYLPMFDHDCYICGTMRMLSHAELKEIGFSAEDSETLRKRGGIWFLDLTGDESYVTVCSFDDPSHELWGALFACGHIDVDGAPGTQVKIDKVIEALMEAFKSAGADPQFFQNFGKQRGFLIAGTGVRYSVSAEDVGATFSLHMDVELLRGYGGARDRFRHLLSATNKATSDGLAAVGSKLLNPNDVDFSYINSETSYTVLRSAQADAIADPVAVAIRDWHRLRTPAPK